MAKNLALRRRCLMTLVGAVFFALPFALSSCTLRRQVLPQELSFQGLVLTVWDCMEPSFQGTDAYQTRVKSVVDRFSEEYQVKVEVEFKERREILSFLMGESQELDPPCLSYSTEWPVISDDAQGLTELLSADDYLDGAATYWMLDGKLMGVPSYVHWVGMAARSSILPLTGIPSDSGYWYDSQWFLPSAIEGPGTDYSAASAISYLEYLKSSCKEALSDPLDAWDRGVVSTLFPVTPHLYRWLRTSYEDEVGLSPIPGASGEMRFHCTVPGYMVFSEEEPHRSCALLLAKELAANRGVWVARSIGGVPAAVQDMPVYDLEAGIPEDYRQIIRGLDSQIAQAALTSGEGLRRYKIGQGFGEIVPQFVRGVLTLQDMERSIQDLWESHTTP